MHLPKKKHCMPVCLCVTSLTAELFRHTDLISTCRSSGRISRSSLEVRVIGQGHQVKKHFSGSGTSGERLFISWNH